MLAQRAFFFRANPQDGIARLLVKASVLSSTRMHFHTSNACRSIRYFASVLIPVRCQASAIDTVDVNEAGTADDLLRAAFECGEDHRLAAFLFLKGFFDEPLKIGNGSHGIGNPSENVLKIALGCFPEKVRMLVANRHQANH